mmetsp:Transcript_11468/g.18708  ORF Transcript_11468/g.18708 Transcript_11468/m.18708 type:complete len:233 (-) Transcript_11468:849-1547(-)
MRGTLGHAVHLDGETNHALGCEKSCLNLVVGAMGKVQFEANFTQSLCEASHDLINAVVARELKLALGHFVSSGTEHPLEGKPTTLVHQVKRIQTLSPTPFLRRIAMFHSLSHSIMHTLFNFTLSRRRLIRVLSVFSLAGREESLATVTLGLSSGGLLLGSLVVVSIVLVIITSIRILLRRSACCNYIFVEGWYRVEGLVAIIKIQPRSIAHFCQCQTCFRVCGDDGVQKAAH